MFQTVPDTSSYVKVRHHRLLDQVMFEGQFGVLSLKTAHSEMILNVKTFSKPLSLFVFKTSVSTPACCQNGLFLCWFYAPVEIFKCYLFFVLFSKSDTCSLSTYRGAFYFSSRGKSLHVYTVKSVLKCGSVVCVIYQTRLNFFFPLYSKNAAITGHKHVWRHELLSPSLSESLFLLVLKM